MGEYKFSVLMSVYKKETPEHFKEALKSNLEEQTVLPDEMVLVCDGELTNQLDEIISEYERKFPKLLKVYRLEENVGLGRALNYGLKKCHYSWVARSDSDDICAPNRFEVQIDYLKKNPDTDILSSYIDEFEKNWQEPVQKKRLPLTHDEIVEKAKFRNPINHMSVVFNRNIICEAGSYQHLPYIEDYYLWVRAIQAGAKFANVDQCLVHARIGNGMLKRRSNREYIKSWKVLNQYQMEHGMIGRMTCMKNMLAIRSFIYMPLKIKELLYKYLLREQ